MTYNRIAARVAPESQSHSAALLPRLIFGGFAGDGAGAESNMHYYKFNIKTYQAATAHLKPMEDLAYRRLIDHYMDTEKPIEADLSRVARRLRTTVQTLEIVLDEFFVLRADGWHNEFCDEEIVSYHSNAEKNKKNGKKGGRPPKHPKALETQETENPVGYFGKPNANPNESQKNLNHKPITINHKPITKNKNITPRKRSVCVSDLVLMGVTEQVASDWMAIRKTKNLPLTQTALDNIQTEADKAGITLVEAITIAARESWAGFKSVWMERLDNTTRIDKSWHKEPGLSFVETNTDRSWADGLMG